jgi:hypothetical protein
MQGAIITQTNRLHWAVAGYVGRVVSFRLI